MGKGLLKVTQLGFQFRPDFNMNEFNKLLPGSKNQTTANPKYIYFLKEAVRTSPFSPNSHQTTQDKQTWPFIYQKKSMLFSTWVLKKNTQNQLWANFKTACKKSFSCFKLQIVAVCSQSIAHVRRAGSEGKHSTRDVYLANKTAVLFVVNPVMK